MRTNVSLPVVFSVFLSTLYNSFIWAQQVADTNYSAPTFVSQYVTGKGAIIHIDEAHHNFHTSTGRYAPFTKLLKQDGYIVQTSTERLTPNHLQSLKILVCANAIHADNLQRWILPTPSAFTKKEIEAVKEWVYKGGSLFLIADHMPFAGAASDLAAAFGFHFYNGFAQDTLYQQAADVFTKTKGGLKECALTKGIDSIATFTGQAFDIPEGATQVIELDKKFTLLECKQAWQFDVDTKKSSAAGKSQLAYLQFGKGKIVVSGEAAMFSAQTVGVQKFGMNSDAGKYNYLLLLKIIHWLDGKKF